MPCRKETTGGSCFLKLFFVLKNKDNRYIAKGCAKISHLFFAKTNLIQSGKAQVESNMQGEKPVII